MRLGGQGLDMARQRIVALVAMQVDHQSALGGDFAQRPHRSGAVGHRALEMRDAADDIHPEVERALEIAGGGRRTEIPVLREGHELQIEIRLHLRPDVDERFDGEQAVVADVDMAADRKQALRHGEVAIAERALGHRLVRQMRLQFAPQRNAFEERAGLVEARLAERQSRVHVEMAIDEGRREEKPTRVERLAGFRVELRSDRGDPAGRRRRRPVPCGRRAGRRCG